MSAVNLVFSEIRFRFVNFFLCLLVIALAAALFVSGPTLISGYAEDTNRHLETLQTEADKLAVEAAKLETQTAEMRRETEQLLAQMDRETRRIMRDMGVNLRIVHQDTNMADLYTDFVAVDFPEDYVHRLAEAEQIELIVHVVATLQDRLKWNNRTVLLVGTLPVLTHSQKNEETPHMVKNIEKGTVLVGHELGFGLNEGDSIEIEGHSLKIARVMPEYGTLQDVQLVTHLEDAQTILNKPGRINQIMALNCKCKGDRISLIRKELEGILPNTKVSEHLTQAEAREKQRDVVEAARAAELARAESNWIRIQENHARQLASNQRQAESRQSQAQTMTRLVALTTPIVVLVSALFVGLMTWLNVRERRSEIGVLRALGKGGPSIASLFLGKAFLMGLLGGVAGSIAGYLLTPVLGSRAMQIGVELFQAHPLLMLATLVGAPLVTTMASYLPTLFAISQDPAIVLMDH
ncbi:MAG: ABC transporter permease [Planctomycetaceae bacterium]|nr:MAG: ABC transporter permease [Planctomycetaceae bacterium]